MENKYSKLALALSTALLVGCGSDSNSSGGGEDTDTDVDAVFESSLPVSPETAINHAAAMIDNLTTAAPKFAYNIESASTDGSSGVASINLKYPSNESQTFYFSLRGESGADDDAVIQLEAKLSNGSVSIKQRNGDTLGSFPADQWVNLAIAWTDGVYALYIDGELATSAAGRTLMNDEAVIEPYFKFANNSATTSNNLYLDNFVIYEDIEQTELIFSDNFDDIPEGTILEGYDGYSSYNDGDITEMVTVKDLGDTDTETDTDTESDTDTEVVVDDFDSYTVGEQIDVASSLYTTSANGTTTFATISDDFASSGQNSLLISDADSTTKPAVSRTFKNGAAEAGSVSVQVYIPTDGYEKASYIYLGTSATGSSSARFTEVVFTSSSIKFRDDTGSQVTIIDYDKDTWVDLTISWDSAEMTGEGKIPVTVNIDGTDYSDIDGATMYAENVSGLPTLTTLYVGDNSAIATYSYFDDLASSLFTTPTAE